MVSLSLRSGVDPKNIVDQLRGITAEPVWDSGRLVRSAPDAVALVLSRHIESIDRLDSEDFSDGERDSTTQLGLFGSASDVETADNPSTRSETSSFVSGVTCSECSVGILVHQEGCLRCPDCGYNKCE